MDKCRCPRGGAAGVRAVCDPPDGSPPALVALFGELMAVSNSLYSRLGSAGHCLGLTLLLAPITGCVLDKYTFSGLPPAAPPPAETVVLTKAGFIDDPRAVASTNPLLITARELFRLTKYDEAELLYHRVSEEKKNTLAEIMEAHYYEAECLRLQGRYPKAANTYVDLLNKFPQNPYREQSIQHMYDIADFWLEDTREEMRERLEVSQGKRAYIWPNWFHWDKSKPVIDESGRACEKLEQVRLNDINGPLADKSLYMCGVVKYMEENYREADHFFTQIYEKHPNSPLAPKAIELAIASKQMSTGGPEYDTRKVAEARKLVHAALENYPELSNTPEKRQHLQDQLAGISEQQAQSELLKGDFYRKHGNLASAYWYYELVTRRYHGTKAAETAAQNLEKLKVEIAKAGGTPGALPDKAPPPQRLQEPTPLPKSLPTSLNP